MSKRTKTDNAKKNPQDFWPTPVSAVTPLARILPPATVYDEPCAGDGALVAGLASYGHICANAFDTMPRAAGIRLQDALTADVGRMIITNPPYRWDLLQPLLDRWIGAVECWLLLPWDMPCNKRMTPYATHIDRVLPLGRVSWMGNGQGGMENSGWFHFAAEPQNMVLPRR